MALRFIGGVHNRVRKRARALLAHDCAAPMGCHRGWPALLTPANPLCKPQVSEPYNNRRPVYSLCLYSAARAHQANANT